MKLPDSWYIAVKNRDISERLLALSDKTLINANCAFSIREDSGHHYFYYYFNGMMAINNSDYDTIKNKSGYKELTIDQLEEMLIKKEPIGYKLKPEFKHLEAAAIRILSITDISNFASHALTNDYDLKHGSIGYDKLKAAGVLDLWFNPIYEILEITEPYKVGDYLYCKKDFFMFAYSKQCPRYTKGKVYLSEREGCITDDENNVGHMMGVFSSYTDNGGKFQDYFRKATVEEIETYKPQSLTIKVQDHEIVIRKGEIKYKHYVINIHVLRDISDLWRSIEGYYIAGHKPTIPFLKVGCTDFTKVSLEYIIKKYEEFNK